MAAARTLTVVAMVWSMSAAAFAQPPSPAKPTSTAQGPAPAKPASPGQVQPPAKPAAPAPSAAPAKPAPVPQGGAAKPAAPTPAPTPAPGKPAAQAEAPPPPSAAATPPAQEAYSYRPEGRRDPFQSLVGAGSEGKVVSGRSEGARGLTVDEISVHGIMQSRGALVAMIQGPDKKTYIVHQGDKLLDGTIKTITAQGLIVVQEVNDPLSLIKQREVRKMLRSLEDAK